MCGHSELHQQTFELCDENPMLKLPRLGKYLLRQSLSEARYSVFQDTDDASLRANIQNFPGTEKKGYNLHLKLETLYPLMKAIKIQYSTHGRPLT